MFKNKNYTLFLHLFNCLQMQPKTYFLLTIAFKTVFYKIYRNHLLFLARTRARENFVNVNNIYFLELK